MNNKTIIEFGLGIIWRIMEISEGVIRLGRHSPRSPWFFIRYSASFITELLNIRLASQADFRMGSSRFPAPRPG